MATNISPVTSSSTTYNELDVSPQSESNENPLKDPAFVEQLETLRDLADDTYNWVGAYIESNTDKVIDQRVTSFYEWIGIVVGIAENWSCELYDELED